jgi:hypothetical protein
MYKSEGYATPKTQTQMQKFLPTIKRSTVMTSADVRPRSHFFSDLQIRLISPRILNEQSDDHGVFDTFKGFILDLGTCDMDYI